jgi:hypothetical protein
MKPLLFSKKLYKPPQNPKTPKPQNPSSIDMTGK